MESALSIHGLRDAERSQKLETNRKEQVNTRAVISYFVPKKMHYNYCLCQKTYIHPITY